MIQNWEEEELFFYTVKGRTVYTCKYITSFQNKLRKDSVLLGFVEYCSVMYRIAIKLRILRYITDSKTRHGDSAIIKIIVYFYVCCIRHKSLDKVF